MCKTQPIRFLFLFSAIILFFENCDSDKFFSFNYEAEQFVELATITGQVSNLFTGLPVGGARIEIENQFTESDDDGFYRLDYQLSDDAGLGRDISITASAEEFLPLTITRQFFPQPVEINFQLELGAPVIEDVSFPELSFVQAIILDYQGVDDIDTVIANIRYLDPATNLVTQILELGMDRIEVVDANRAHYQLVVVPQHPQFGSVSPGIIVTVIDQSGFISAIEHTNNPFNPDTFLFDPGI